MPTLSRRQPSLDLRSSARNSVESTNSYASSEQKLWVLNEEGERHLPEMDLPKAKKAALPSRKQSSRNLYLTTKAELHEQRYQSSEEEASPSPDGYDTGDECGLDSERGSMCEKSDFEDMVIDDDEVPVVLTARMVIMRVVRPKLITISSNMQKRKRSLETRERLTSLDENTAYTGAMAYMAGANVPKREDSLEKKLEKKIPLPKPRVKTPEYEDVSPLSKPGVKHVKIEYDYFASFAPPKPAREPTFDEYSVSHSRPRAAATNILDDYSLSFAPAPAPKKSSQSLQKPASASTSRSTSPARSIQQSQTSLSKPPSTNTSRSNSPARPRPQALLPEQLAAYAPPKTFTRAQTFDDYDYSASFAPVKRAVTQPQSQPKPSAPAVKQPTTHHLGWQPQLLSTSTPQQSSPPAPTPQAAPAPGPLTTSLRTRSRPTANLTHGTTLKLSPRASISGPLSPPRIGTQFSSHSQNASSPSSPAYSSLLGAYGSGDPTTPASPSPLTPTPTQDKFAGESGASGRWRQVRRSMSHLKRMGSPVLGGHNGSVGGRIDEIVEAKPVTGLGIKRMGRVQDKDTREKREGLDWSYP
ncbi:MAG: hypothetical protein MMC33_006821 [Icmadophila ericetorum]|nr:hypothetical protein [Icmadophila ericetorum]